VLAFEQAQGAEESGGGAEEGAHEARGRSRAPATVSRGANAPPGSHDPTGAYPGSRRRRLERRDVVVLQGRPELFEERRGQVGAL